MGAGISIRRFSLPLNDGLRSQVSLATKKAASAPNPLLFKPAEGSKRIVSYCIDQDPAGGKFACHAVCPLGARRAYVSDKPEFRIIGHLNVFGFRLVCQYRQDGSEDFFLRDAHIAGHIGEHGRLDEIPALKSGRMTFASDNELRTFLDA